MTLDELEKEIYSVSKEIPFENSDFQNDFFVLKSNYTKGRAYRALLLRLSSKIQALQEAKYNLEKEQIDLEEADYKIEEEKKKESPNTFEIRRLELEKKKKQQKVPYLEKLVYDAIHEIEHLYEIYKKFPKYTREQFEKEEAEHFKIRLERAVAGVQGALDSLTVMTNDPNIIGADKLQQLDGILQDKSKEENIELNLAETLLMENAKPETKV